MRTIGLNLAVVLLWVALGWSAKWYLIPLSVGILVYSFTHDWRRDSAKYREALAEIEHDDEAVDQPQ
jgi:hypothetical protein